MESRNPETLIRSSLETLASEDEGNVIGPAIALEPQASGKRIYAQPLVAFGSAHDTLFDVLRDSPEAGLQMRTPDDWLEGAESIVSYFFPMSEDVRVSNRGAGRASAEWFHARIDGQAFILKAGRHLVALLEDLGYRAVCPAASGDFSATFIDEGNPSKSFRSNWSERHVAYICGLGTFSLSKGLITEAGTAGRFGSIITTAPLQATKRAYEGLYDYCIECGACVANCPVNAISLETGKDHFICYDEVIATKRFYPGYYGCGKCQVDVPCEYRRP